MSNINPIAVIPARFASARFPEKMLADLNGVPLITQTFLSVQACNLFENIIVATDNDDIERAIKKVGGNIFRSKKNHDCGTDRIAEAAENIDANVIINVQGDEPFIQKHVIQNLIDCFKEDDVDVASVMQRFKNSDDFINPNYVKVLVSLQNVAMYFSRYPLPFNRDLNNIAQAFHHIGMYGFRKNALQKFAQQGITKIEAAEKIEAIRFLEMGLKMKMALVEYNGVQVDSPEDLERAKKFLIS